MKIIYLLPSYANKAGTERVISDKINFLAGKGFEITLVTYEQGNHSCPFPLHPSVRVVDLDTRFFELRKYSCRKRFFLHLGLRRRFKKRLQNIVDEVLPDIVICTTYSLKLLDVILCIQTNAYRVVESHVAFFTIKKSYEYRHIPIIHNLAELYDHYIFSRLKKCDLMVVLTEGDAIEWRKHVTRVVVVPNPITFYPEHVLPHDGNGRRIICVGRLHEQKGFDMLVDAFALIAEHCSDWIIDIYGDGSDKMFLLDRIQQANLQNRIAIKPPTSTIYDEYQRSEFLVLSSRYEGFALVVNEAMSCGIPCVAFRCKYGPEDAIQDGVDGLLVENGNINDLANKMLWMINHTEDRLRMGSKARETSYRYHISRIMPKWIKLFEELISSQGE
jgi:glycosyltransferase involved in cell wall biosynthesis